MYIYIFIYINRSRIIHNMPKLRHLDLRPITADERTLSLSISAREEINETEKMLKNEAIINLVSVDTTKVVSPVSTYVRTPSNRALDTVVSPKNVNALSNSTPVQWGSFIRPLNHSHIDTNLNTRSIKAPSKSPHIYHDKAFDHQVRFISAEYKDWRWPWSVSESQSLLWLAGVSLIATYI
jgi:hypothetical protein